MKKRLKIKNDFIFLGTDEETIRQYERREMQIHDEITRIQGAKEEGKQEGIKEGIIRMARNMLNGNMDTETVKQVTGLTTEELEEIRKQLN